MLEVLTSDFCFLEAVDAAPDPTALGSASIFRLGALAAPDEANALEEEPVPITAAAAAAAAAPIAKGFVEVVPGAFVATVGEAAGKPASVLPVPDTPFVDEAPDPDDDIAAC